MKTLTNHSYVINILIGFEIFNVSAYFHLLLPNLNVESSSPIFALFVFKKIINVVLIYKIRSPFSVVKMCSELLFV